MIEWANAGRKILARRQDLDAKQRALMEECLRGVDSAIEDFDPYKSFSNEARRELMRLGYRIYPLTGQSIRLLQEAGRSFGSSYVENDHFYDLSSRRSEVAINPNSLYIGGSSSSTLEEQEKLVSEFSEGLKSRSGGLHIKAIIGEAPDYAELAFSVLDSTGKILFGESYGSGSIRTVTSSGYFNVVHVGASGPRSGLSIDYFNRDYRASFIRVAPLVVPDL